MQPHVSLEKGVNDNSYIIDNWLMCNCCKKASLLWTNTESRFVALGGKQKENPVLINVDDHHCWMNLDVDITWLVSIDVVFSQILKQTGLFQAKAWRPKRVAMSAIYFFETSWIRLYELLVELSQYPIEEIILLVGHEEHFRIGEVDFLDVENSKIPAGALQRIAASGETYPGFLSSWEGLWKFKRAKIKVAMALDLYKEKSEEGEYRNLYEITYC